MAMSKFLVLKCLKMEQFYPELEGSVNEQLRLYDLLQKDENGITYLEHLCKMRISIYSEKLYDDILLNKEVLYVFAQHNHMSWISHFKIEPIFFMKVDGDITLIEYMLEKKLRLFPFLFEHFKKDPRIIDYLVKYNSSYISYLSPDMVVKLLTKQDGKYLADKYYKNEKIKELLAQKGDLGTVVSFCKSKRYYDIFQYLSEGKLLTEYKPGLTILELLLQKKKDPKFGSGAISSLPTIDILLKYERYDLLCYAKDKLLLEKYKGNMTYLELMCEKQKEGIDVHLENVQYFADNNTLARELLILAKYNYQGFVPMITVNMLVHYDGDKNLLQCLFEYDKELTLSRIIPACLNKDDPRLAFYLRGLGVNDAEFHIETTDESYTDNHLKVYNSQYAENCKSLCPDLIEEFKDLFNADWRSNKRLIDCLVSSYTYATSEDNIYHEYAIQELKQLIQIKKSNPKFSYVYDDGKSCFGAPRVYIDKPLISTINHETGHALHYYLAENKVPEEYYELAAKVRSNPKIIDKVYSYSRQYQSFKSELRSSIDKSGIRKYYEKLAQGLNKTIVLNQISGTKIKFFSSINYHTRLDPSFDVEQILSQMFNYDEFLKQRVNIEVKEMVCLTLRNYYSSLLAISDILDSIFLGRVMNEAIFDSHGEKIERATGHGIQYYKYRPESTPFKEIVANYSDILKSKNGENMINYLRSIIGDEMVDLIDNFYKHNILESTNYTYDDEMEETAGVRS